MSRSIVPVWLVGMVFAAMNSGCAVSRFFTTLQNSGQQTQFSVESGKSRSEPHDNRRGYLPPQSPTASGVVQAQALQPTVTEELSGVTVSNLPGNPIAAGTAFGTANPAIEKVSVPPITVPVPPATPPATLTTAPPVTIPPVGPAHTLPAALPTTIGGPNVRMTPTVVGGILGLGPNEQPLDRALEMSKQIEAHDIENKILHARIKTLEANAASREESLNESIRDVETATAEVLKARNDVANLRKELATVKSKLSLAERDEIETLKLIVEALEKVLAADGKR